jgi:Zn-finger in ubiquitin-hydrolases and other protein
MSDPLCGHLDTIEHLEGREGVPGCPECLASGSHWVHLRRCTQCGQVGCCDDSPNRHATKHHHASGHPVIRSLEPGEDWLWCYVDEVGFRIAGG